MKPLFDFLGVNMGVGFMIGLVVGFAFILSNGESGLFVGEPLATVMLLWGFGATFGLGALGTGLALLPFD